MDTRKISIETIRKKIDYVANKLSNKTIENSTKDDQNEKTISTNVLPINKSMTVASCQYKN